MIEILLQADRALGVGFLDQAERMYWQAIERDPRNAIAVVGLARVAVERGDETAAHGFVSAALSIDPESASARRLADELESRGISTAPGAMPDLRLLATERLAALGRRQGSEAENAPGESAPAAEPAAAGDAPAIPPTRPEPEAALVAESASLAPPEAAAPDGPPTGDTPPEPPRRPEPETTPEPEPFVGLSAEAALAAERAAAVEAVEEVDSAELELPELTPAGPAVVEASAGAASSVETEPVEASSAPGTARSGGTEGAAASPASPSAPGWRSESGDAGEGPPEERGSGLLRRIFGRR